MVAPQQGPVKRLDDLRYSRVKAVQHVQGIRTTPSPITETPTAISARIPRRSRVSRRAADEAEEISLARSIRFIYECSTVITTFPLLCPCSTYLKASAICAKG